MRKNARLHCAVILAASLSVISVAARDQAPTAATGWTQWGGPTRDFHAGPTSVGLADTWPAEGPPVLWTRPLGTGHSSIVVDDGRLFTLYRAGNGRAKLGPWKTEEVVVALDAKTGATIWEHAYPARSGFEDFSFGPGPHSTPLVVGDRVFTTGTNQQLFAFDKRTGKVLWSHDLIKEFNSPELLLRPNVKTGYGCSPIAYAPTGTIICSVGGPGQSVMAFRQSDGVVVWKSGDFLTSPAAPILIQIGGRHQLVFFAGGTVTGLNPGNGAILWSHPHDPGNDLNCGTPLFGPDNVLFVSSAYQAGSRALQLSPEGKEVTEAWFTNRVRFMFLSAVRIGDSVYGTTGDFGPAFLTALNIKTGESAWQVRGFARASLLAADGKVIILNEDGDLALTRLSATGAEILSRTKIFDTVSWTAPTLVGTTLYARDREKIVALDLASKEVKGVKEVKASGATVGVAASSAPSEDFIRSLPPGASITFVQPLPRGTVSPAQGPASRPSLAGSWKLDPTTSMVTTGAAFSGLHPAGGPLWLFVTQPANGSLILESATNASQARFYRPGGSTTTSTATGTITMSMKWEGPTVIAEGRATTTGGAVTAIKETLARDGDALVVTIVAGDKTSTLRYTRLTETGPCTSWPTACKKAGG